MLKTSAGRFAILLLSSATIAAATWAEPAIADDTTYNVDQTIGKGAVVGQIETNGATGVLTTADITGWNLTLNGVGASLNLTSASGTSVVEVDGADLTATSKYLYFNFSGADSGFLLFQDKPSLDSGNKYYCNNTNNFTCEAGATVAPKNYLDPTAQNVAESGEQIIGTVGPVGILGPNPAVEASVLALADARTAQMLLNQMESQILLGLNEQVSCGNCGGGDASVGSFNLSTHGRYALSPEWTVLGGVDLGEYRQKGADVDFTAGFAAALQFDPANLGPSRPYAEVGLAGSFQNVRYARSYPDGAGMATGVGAARDYEGSADAEVGWVDRLTARDEAAVYVDYSRMWQDVGAYAEQTGASNPVNAAYPGGTDTLEVASLNAQYTHLFGRRVEADVNGGVDWAFKAQSGLQANVDGGEISPIQPAFRYYEVGGRIGIRLKRRVTVDMFVNGMLAPRAIGSSAHGGLGVRFDF